MTDFGIPLLLESVLTLIGFQERLKLMPGDGRAVMKVRGLG